MKHRPPKRSVSPLLHVCVEERVRVRRSGGLRKTQPAHRRSLLTRTLSSTRTWRRGLSDCSANAPAIHRGFVRGGAAVFGRTRTLLHVCVEERAFGMLGGRARAGSVTAAGQADVDLPERRR
jgi:hypothetical protein